MIFHKQLYVTTKLGKEYEIPSPAADAVYAQFKAKKTLHWHDDGEETKDVYVPFASVLDVFTEVITEENTATDVVCEAPTDSVK